MMSTLRFSLWFNFKDLNINFLTAGLIVFLVFGLFCNTIAQQNASPVPQIQAHHGQVITLKGFEMNHQGGVVMDLSIEFGTGFTKYPFMGELLLPDIKQEIMDEAVDYLSNYPNTTDFFEIVNSGLNQHLRNEFPELLNLQVRFRIDPRPNVAFIVLSGTEYSSGDLNEFYGFVLDEQSTEHQGLDVFDVNVWFQYQPNLEPSAIPNVISVRQNVLNFIDNYPNTTDFFEIYTKAMATNILDGFSALQNVEVEISIPPVGETLYDRFSKVFYDRQQYQESFGYIIPTPNEDNLVSYTTTLDYKIGIENSEYPNIVAVEESVREFIDNLDFDESPAIQLHNFLSDYWSSFNGVVSKMNVGFSLNEYDGIENMSYNGFVTANETQSGFGFNIEFDDIGEGESIIVQTAITERFLNSLNWIDRPDTRIQIYNQITDVEFEGDLIQMNNEVIYKFSEVSFFLGKLSSSVTYSSGNFSSIGYADAELLWANSINNEPTNPVEISLEQNYPNPFNPSTQIAFSIPNSGHVNLSVYNVLGQQVKVLVNETLHGGQHNTQFDGQSLASGVYFYRLVSNNQVYTRSMVLIK